MKKNIWKLVQLVMLPITLFILVPAALADTYIKKEKNDHSFWRAWRETIKDILLLKLF